MELWEWSLDICKETEMKARIRGVQGMMTTFDFYFGCSLGELILRQTDNSSRALQHSSMSAVQGHELAHVVIETLSKDRNEASFNLFWERLLQRKNEIPLVGEPQLPRKRKVPKRQEIGEHGTRYFPSNPKEHYRHIYFSAMDATIQSIRSRFDQKDFKVYENIQERFF
jgi:hypothetical protein